MSSGVVILDNIPSTVGFREITDEFGRYGVVTGIGRNLSSGRVEVQYEDFRDAEVVARELDGTSFPTWPVDVVAIRRVPFERREEPEEEEEELERRPIEREIPGFESRRYMTVRDVGPLLQSGQVRSYIIDPQNQIEVPAGLTRLTFIGTDGREYDALARHDPVTNQIFPPA